MGLGCNETPDLVICRHKGKIIGRAIVGCNSPISVYRCNLLKLNTIACKTLVKTSDVKIETKCDGCRHILLYANKT